SSSTSSSCSRRSAATRRNGRRARHASRASAIPRNSCSDPRRRSVRAPVRRWTTTTSRTSAPSLPPLQAANRYFAECSRHSDARGSPAPPGPRGADSRPRPRLKAFREEWRRCEPDWFNAPVASFGARKARLLIVGLAPGLRGANRTGRPFTGDYAGDLLYQTLKRFGFARGRYQAQADDGLTLIDARITNAVRCVPPGTKPTPEEIKTCRAFLLPPIAEMRNLRAIVTLGRISHETTIAALGERRSAAPFGHGGSHVIGKLRIFASYHCSRYNTSTGVLTPPMFRAVFAKVRAYLDA